MHDVKIKIVNKSGNPLPEYQSAGAAGVDLCCTTAFEIWPGQTMSVPTGLFVEIPSGYELQIRSRSGLAARKGLVILNSPGTIDSDYRGEIQLILHAVSSAPAPVSFDAGARVAQAVLAVAPRIFWEEVAELEKTSRSDGGFGSTGVYKV